MDVGRRKDTQHRYVCIFMTCIQARHVHAAMRFTLSMGLAPYRVTQSIPCEAPYAMRVKRPDCGHLHGLY